MENNSTLENVLLVCNRNAKLLLLVGATFISKLASLRMMKKKNFIILKSLQNSTFFVLFVCRCRHLSCQISIERVRKIIICSPNVLMPVLYFPQYYHNLYFYWNSIWNIDLNNGPYCDIRNKSACLNTA